MPVNMDNYSGAVLFIGYIAAALFCILFVITTLLSFYKSRASQLPPGASSKIHLLAGLAGLSFSVLSHRMIDVLLQSLSGWKQRTGCKHEVSVDALWAWMKESSLSRDFARDLWVAQGTVWWTYAALTWTMGVSLYMASNGKQKKVPNLWAFFVLGQILPVSFTQILFYIASVIATEVPKPNQELKKVDNDKDKSELIKEIYPEISEPNLSGAFLLLSTVTYVISTNLLPYAVDSPVLHLLILIPRLLLFVPYLLPEEATKLTEPAMGFLVVTGTISTFARASYLVVHGWTLQQSLASLNKNPPTRALGYDLLIGVASSLVWMMI
ncbi:hypothetical protein M501DRAFT_1012824 [Patellaria atrata CBS 101060]|uniref:Uncharacterized protein n=1 Tax=Patellaria atrata CBS 101060 TaxID=1346257 RepID=A0A9P4SJ29_9PEZI|nr:hypothetical protein M501DRAFT_1012824 [Patellaria atrata CBS 101060]